MRIEVPLAQASRLLNHGPTVLVSSQHGNQRNLMAAAWAMPLDFMPPKVAVVIDRQTLTRRLIEASGVFALSVPTLAMADLCTTVGSVSGQSLIDQGREDKFGRFGIDQFSGPVLGLPLPAQAIAWLECRVLPDFGVFDAYDLLPGEVVSAWADAEVYRDGRWHFEAADPRRSIHHVGGGVYFTLGEMLHTRNLDAS